MVGIKKGMISSLAGTDCSMSDGAELQLPAGQPQLSRSRQSCCCASLPHGQAAQLAAGTHCHSFAAGSAGCRGPTVHLRSANTLCWHVNLLLAGNTHRDSKREKGERWGGSQVTEHLTECQRDAAGAAPGQRCLLEMERMWKWGLLWEHSDRHWGGEGGRGGAATGLCAATSWHRELHTRLAGLHSGHKYSFARNDPTDVWGWKRQRSTSPALLWALNAFCNAAGWRQLQPDCCNCCMGWKPSALWNGIFLWTALMQSSALPAALQAMLSDTRCHF